MNKLVILVAVTLGTAVTQEALACDWQREANATPVTIADCSGQSCMTEQPTTGEPTQPTTQEPKQKIADEPASPAPTTVADCSSGNC